MNRIRCGGGGGSGNSFTPTSLFASGEPGIWLDQSADNTGRQDVSNTAAALNSPIGLRFDKRLSMAQGAELVTLAPTNGTTAPFETFTTSGVTITSAVNTAGAGGGACWDIGLQASGVTIAVVITTTITSGTVQVYLATDLTGAGAAASNAVTLAAGANTVYLTTTLATGRYLTYAEVGTAGSNTAATAISARTIAGNHVRQLTAAARPLWKLDGTVYSDLFDGVDDGLSSGNFAAGTLTSDMDVFVALKRNATTNMVVCSQTPSDGSRYFALSSSGGAGLCATGIGSLWSTYVDGLQVGGVNSTTSGQLHTALGSATNRVLEMRNINTALWTQFTLGQYTGFMLSANVAGLILCPAQTAATRNSIRRWIGAKAGLSL